MGKMDIIDSPVSGSARIDSESDEPESGENYTRVIFKTFLLFSILALVIFGIKNALIGAFIESGLNFGTAGIAAGIIYAQRFVHRTAHLCRASLLVLGVLYFYIAGVGGQSGYKILWINLFPLASFFMMGSREGLAWSLTFLAGMVFWLSDANTLVPVYPYDADFRTRVPMVYLTMTVLMYTYENARRLYQRGLDRKRNQLLAEKKKLVSANQEIAASNMRIRQSEIQYKLVVDNAHDAIFISQDGRLRFANPTARHFFGIQDDSPLDLPLADLIHPRDRETVMARHRTRMKGEQAPNDYVFRVVNRLDGQSRWLRINAVIIEWNGRPAVISFCHDITQAKALEMQLLQAQKMQAIGSLAGGIAHDFNNMLSAIVGYTEMAIATESADAAVRSRLDRVLEASDRARGLIGQILAFSRQQSEESRPVAVAPVVRDALGLLQATKAPNIEIHTNLEDCSGVVVGDGNRIHQVVMNLCTNAFHAMKGTGGRLTVSLERIGLERPGGDHALSLPPGDYIRLKIEDTGCGMDPLIQHRIFDPYFTTKEKGEGTGLGLSVVHGIVKSHEGEIAVSSEPGRGTTFEVYLPRSRHGNRYGADSAPGRSAAPRHGNHSSGRRRKNCHGDYSGKPGEPRLPGGGKGQQRRGLQRVLRIAGKVPGRHPRPEHARHDRPGTGREDRRAAQGAAHHPLLRLQRRSVAFQTEAGRHRHPAQQTGPAAGAGRDLAKTT